MTDAPKGTQAAGGSKVIRIIVLINFLWVLALFGPQSSGRRYRAFLNAISVGPEVLAEQLWIIGSTVFATGLFAWNVIKKRRIKAATERTPKEVVLDGVFLFVWWTTLLVICGYFFMIGMAG